ncbi:kinetochore Sim4 complex subunit Fta4 [Xylaria bambusicola]|uniref:kinetochore Sim4 complex subunit Fta4 n=1 Tax=Xylaria bambusicola TaxID=326684 RepID=UPI0020076C30|nr:kinetochore Sim4 complex subunit Fta4 [Xylaria bambusicola]KAI0528149.1 kinetochore Sim4 complex subunit Fta4 [Xylaria bambusicola]
MAPPTIIAHKSAFLATQTLHLSQTLAPSATWRASNDTAEDGLSARAVDDALYRLNHTLTQHARRVYAPQASRYLAEQIEGLFYEEADRALAGDDDDENPSTGIEKQRLNLGADLTTDEAIASLPPTWDIHKPREAEAHALEAKRYAEQMAALTDLAARRAEVRERVVRLRRMAALLAPFDTNTNNSADADDTTMQDSTPISAVQANLITRNGEVERELERMRLLLARVAGRIAQLPDNKGKNTSSNDADHEDFMDLDALERDKVEKLLDRL